MKRCWIQLCAEAHLFSKCPAGACIRQLNSVTTDPSIRNIDAGSNNERVRLRSLIKASSTSSSMTLEVSRRLCQDARARVTAKGLVMH